MLKAALFAFLALAFAVSPAMADVQYIYDEAGRLVQVVDQNGDSARYVYDAAGNITQILRITAGTLAVTAFAPKSGPVGTAVTIHGSGFSATPASNTVKFNGASASVTSASANQLVAVVPAGATSGTIAVTVGAQTASSAESFLVTAADDGAPTISSFTPGGGAAGTSVTITGTNFDPVAANDVVRFNDAQRASVSSATDTQIAAVVPPYAGSGPITVRTLRGTAVSADDFIVPPPGYTYADIVSRVRVAIDGPSGSLSIGSANKHGVALFNAGAGDYLSLQLSSLSVSPSGPVAYKVFDPKNLQIASGTVSSTAMSIHLPALTAAGTYSVFFSPGAATATLTLALTRNLLLSAAQPTINSTIGVAGQSTRIVFGGVSGASASFRLGVTSTVPANQSVAMTLYKDAMEIATASGSSSNDGAVIAPLNLPLTGSYFLVVAPANAATGSISVALNPSIDLAIDGPPLSISSSLTGAGKRILFSGTAGQSIGIGLTELAYSPSSATPTTVNVYNPDGSLLKSTSGTCKPSSPNGSCTNALAPLNLPATGVYQVTVVPPANVTFSGKLTASTGVGGEWSAGTPRAIELTRPGQFASFNFNATAGDPVTLRLGIASTVPANQSVTMELWGPTGRVGSVSGSPGTDGVAFYDSSLPATGLYGVVIVPSYAAIGSLALTRSPAMDFTIDGPALNASTSTPGYQKRLLFSGTAGQSIGFALTALAYSPSSPSGTSVNIYNPSGSLLATTSGTCTPGNPNGGCSNALAPVNLPTTGVYQVTIAPPANVSFTGTLTASSPFFSLLNPGTAVPVSITRPGQHAAFNFSASAGQSATLRLAVASTLPANQPVTLSLWGPSGQVGSSVTGSPASDGLIYYRASLPATATYGVIVVPKYGATGSMTLTLAPATDFAIDGAPLAASTTTAGYQKRLTFSATAGQQIGLALTGLAYSPSSTSNTSMAILKPDGSQLAGTSTCNPSNPGGGCTAGILNLPSTGDYQVLLTPPPNATLSGTLTASTPVYGSLASATPLAVNVTRAGQFGNVGFSGTAGQATTLRMAIPSTTPANQTVTMTLWGPSGQVGSSKTGTPSSDGTILYVASLPSTGNYAVSAVPSFGATASMTLTRDPASDFSIDGASANVATASAGYLKRYVLNVAANERIDIGVSGVAHTPTTSSTTVLAVLRPDGGTAVSTTCPAPGLSSCDVSFNTVTAGPAGPYTVLFTPPASSSFAGGLTASHRLTGSLTIGGASVPLALDRDGLKANLAFSGTSGQLLRLSVTGLSTEPAGHPVYFYIMRSDFSVITSTFSTGPTVSFNIPALDSTGTFYVVVVPVFGLQADMNISLDPR